MTAAFNTQDVRHYASTETTDYSLTVRQREFAFDAWLDSVKKEAAAAARAEVLDKVIKSVATRTKKVGKGADWEPLSSYDEGRNAGLTTAYNIAYDLKNPTAE
jgi:uncharacterized protein YhdP